MKLMKPFLFFLQLFIVLIMNAENCPEPKGLMRINHEEFDQARLNSNYYTSKNSFPDAIIYAQSTKDVQDAVRWAICKKLQIRIRSGGHNHESFSTGKGLVIDVSKMKEVKIDRNKKIATIQPGITGGELYKLLSEDGLTQVGGTCADVGISGLVLTGGMGPLLRKHGLTCDNLIAFEMVNAKGEVIKATKDNEHKDLFWASCGGGGGNFGVVTSIVMQLYHSQPVTWFNIGWEWDQSVEEIIATWQKLFNNGDKKWFSHLDVWSKKFPSEKLNKMPIKVLGVYYGTPEEARRDLEPFLKIGHPKDQTIKTVEWVQAIREFEEATAVYLTEKPEYKSTGAFAMKPLPQEAIKIILETLKKTESPLLNVLLFSMGGACADIPPTETAYYYRKAPFFVVYSTQWLNQSQDKQSIAEVDALRFKLLPYTEGNYAGNPDRNLKNYLIDYYGDNVKRLEGVKKKYDPDNLFQFEQGLK